MEIFRSKKLRFTVYGLRICAFALLYGPLYVFAVENEQRVPSSITNVTVFLNQAQVTRVAKVSLQAGITNLVFDRVSPYINLNSIQVKTESNVNLLSVSQRNNYLNKEDKPAFIIELEDTLERLNYEVAMLVIRRDALLVEKEVIAANKKIGGENSGVKIEDLEDALVLFRKRTQEIGEELLKLRDAEKKLTTIKQKIQAQLVQYNSNANSAAEIVVTIKTLGPVSNTKIEWSYLVSNASWKPFYDVRVKDTKSELQLVSKAYITQATGEEWKNVILKLSTANPNESGSKPELQPNYLGYLETVYGYSAAAGNAAPEPAMDMNESDVQAAPAEPELQSNYTTRNATQEIALNYSVGLANTEHAAVNIEFAVTSAYTVPSDNTPHQVDLTVSNLNAEYAYGTTPKLDKDAFVTAKVSGNDLVNQVSGEANVYFDGTFVGKTYINGTTSDSMLISLGRDKRIQIQRTLLKDFSSKTFTGSNRKELSTWEISLRNTRKEAVTLVIEDQIPVSTNKEIEVKLINSGNAAYDNVTGKLTWTLRLEPEQSQAVKFSFEVKYPKAKALSGY
ncbi:MAG: mucoidy inhibitor MuiA family protein [Bacteroidota bacterium]